MDRTKHILPPILGFYSYYGAPIVYLHAGDTHSLEAIAHHEQAHKALTEHSSVGILTILYIWGDDRTLQPAESLRCAVALAAETNEVQEGLATFAEYATGDLPLDAFSERLTDLSQSYRQGFVEARRIENILSAGDL